MNKNCFSLSHMLFFVAGLISGLTFYHYSTKPFIQMMKDEASLTREHIKAYDAGTSSIPIEGVDYTYSYGPTYSPDLCYTGLRDVLSGVLPYFRFYKPYFENSDWIYYPPPTLRTPWDYSLPKEY